MPGQTFEEHPWCGGTKLSAWKPGDEVDVVKIGWVGKNGIVVVVSNIFHRVFPYKPSILGVSPYFWKHPYNWENWRYQTTLSRWWFQIFFIFIPIGGNDPIWRSYFSDGLKPPTRNGWKTILHRAMHMYHMRIICDVCVKYILLCYIILPFPAIEGESTKRLQRLKNHRQNSGGTQMIIG